MDELTKELCLEKEASDRELKEKNMYLVSDRQPKLSYWGKMAYWSHNEGIALLLERDPKILNLDVLAQEQWHVREEVLSRYLDLTEMVLRAFEMQELKERNAPEIFLEWAENRGIKVPEALWQAVSARKNAAINRMTRTEMENLLKIKEEEIVVLQKKIDELKTMVWEGFDENASTYSKELAIAVKAHEAISKSWKKGMSIKQQITIWLEKNHSKLGNEERERIAKICNWQKSGGAPSTP